MAETKEFAQVSDPAARDTIAMLREEVASLSGKVADLNGNTNRLAIVCERSLILAERATNIAESSNERALQITAAQSQIQTALNVVIQQYAVIKTIGDKNAVEAVEMRETVGGLRSRIDDMHDVIVKMQGDLYVALGTSKTAEEMAGAAASRADAARQEAAAAKQEARTAHRETTKLHTNVEHIEERLDITANKRILELEAHRQKSETNLEAQAREGLDFMKKRAEVLEKLALEEAEADRKREQWEREQEERKLKIKEREVEERWASIGKVLAPTVLLALIGLLVTIAGRC